MKKAIIFSLLLLTGTLGMSLNSKAASIALYSGTPPAWVTVTIDGSNNVTVYSPYNATLYRVDFIRNNPWSFWSVAVPGYETTVFSSEGANYIALAWSTPGGTATAQYYVSY
ncbi:hypothetical protein [uncultured Chitinophaga sp.]|uniref:hypothetical protein n=1 Tax=uncultured Chitinophaga sp. TaxID=339340 RepID=UPI0025E989CF|nr:hypothetical protein [uncultured Chitinophaga sp.]